MTDDAVVTAGSVVILVGLAVSLWALWRRMHRVIDARVAQDHHLPGPPEVEGPRIEALLRGLSVQQSGVQVSGVPGHTVVATRRPFVMGLLLGLLMPVVLIVAIFDLVQNGTKRRLDVRVFAGPTGTVVRTEGVALLTVLAAVQECVQPSREQAAATPR